MDLIKSTDQAVCNELQKCVSVLKALAMTTKKDVVLKAENKNNSLTAQISCNGEECEVSIFMPGTNDQCFLYPSQGTPWETPNSELIALLGQIRDKAGQKMLVCQ